MAVVYIGAIVLVWPVLGAVGVAVRRPPPGGRWRPFAAAAITAATVGVVLLAASFWLFATNGTTRSMAALGPQIGGVACLGGALLSGLVAATLRVTGRPRQDGSAAG